MSEFLSINSHMPVFAIAGIVILVSFIGVAMSKYRKLRRNGHLLIDNDTVNVVSQHGRDKDLQHNA